MGLQAKWVYGDSFAAGTLAEIPYKVFVVRSNFEPTDGSTAAANGSSTATAAASTTAVSAATATTASANDWSADDVLLRAEAAMLSENEPVCFLHGELWTFSLGSSPPPDPPESLARCLTAVAQGVLLPPFTADNTATRYLPVLAAIESLCWARLLRHGHRQFLPFGRSVLCVPNGSVVRVEPSLSPEGDLRLRIVSSRAHLEPLSSSPKPLPSRVWVLPQGRPAKVVGQHVEPPSPPLARAFHSFVSSLRLFPVPLPALEECSWLDLSLDGELVRWPVPLIVCAPVEDTFGTAFDRSYSAVETQVRLHLPSDDGAPSTIDAEMEAGVVAEVPAPANTTSNTTNTSGTAASTTASQPTLQVHPAPPQAARLHQTIHPPPAPPPSPSPATLSFSHRHLHHHHQHQPPPSRSEEGVYPTPVYHSPPQGSTPAVGDTPGTGEFYGGEWGDEVTNADFNFFDEPESPVPALKEESRSEVLQSESPAMKEESVPPATEPSPSPVEPSLVEIAKTESPEPMETESAAFAQLAFSDRKFSSLDSKYSAGGVYFYPAQDDADAVESPTITAHDNSDLDSNDDSDMDMDTDLPDALCGASPYVDVMNADSEMLDGDWDDHEWTGFKERRHALDDTEAYTGAWASALAPTAHEPAAMPALDAVSNENLQLLVAQVVWDGGLLGDLYNSPFLSGPDSAGDSVVVQCLRAAFPALRNLSVADLRSTAHGGATTSANASGTASPVVLGSRPPTPSGTRRSSSVDSTSLLFKPQHSTQPHIVLRQQQQQQLKLHSEAEESEQKDDVKSESSEASPAPVAANNGSGANGNGISSANTNPVTTSTNPAVPTASTAPNTSTTSPAQKDDDFALLSPPLYSFARGDNHLKARAAALRFWRPLDLKPTGPPRDIVVIMIVLAHSNVEDRTRMVLQSLQQTYEGCGLGQLQLPTFGDVHRGLYMVQADLQHTSQESIGDVFEIACAQIKRQLLATASTGQPPVTSESLLCVTMAWPRGLAAVASPLPLARGFQAIRSAFPNARWLLAPLQLITATDVVLSQFRQVRIALLLYDRWVPRTTVQPPSTSPTTPAVVLAHLASQSIQLRYAAKSLPRVLDDELVLHVAYAVSVDRRWVSVAWTDQWARTTKVAVLRLTGSTANPSLTRAASPAANNSGPTAASAAPNDNEAQPGSGSDADKSDGSMLRALHRVLGEIWSRTSQMCIALGGDRHRRVSIVKCGRLDPKELAIWQRLPGVKPGEISVFYLSHPRGLCAAQASSSIFEPALATATEPTQSPQPPTTPQKDDSVAVSVRDETHGLAYHNKVVSVGAGSPALATGFLVMPSPDGYLQLEVSLAHTAEPQPKRVVSRTLGQYRRLATHAEVMGITAESTIMPWHVAAVNKLTAFLATTIIG